MVCIIQTAVSAITEGFDEKQHDYWESDEWSSANTIHWTKLLSSRCWTVRGPRGPCGVIDLLSEQRKGGGGCSVYMGREGSVCGDTEQCDGSLSLLLWVPNNTCTLWTALLKKMQSVSSSSNWATLFLTNIRICQSLCFCSITCILKQNTMAWPVDSKMILVFFMNWE